MNRQETFSQWFDDQLQAAGMSGKELATRVGVSEATISRVRNGRTPLSPRMKNLLSSALNTRTKDIPSVAHSTITVNRKLWVVQHAVPDHATTNYACHQGLFLNRGISVEELPDRDIGAGFPESYIVAIKEQLAKGRSVLAVGPEADFKQHGLEAIGSVLSHTYRGYHLVARANTCVPSVDDAPLHQRLYTLKLFLEQMENAQVWAHGFDRFAWQTSQDLKFLRLLRALSAELTGVEREHWGDDYHELASNKIGLDSLHAFGHQGAQGKRVSIKQWITHM